MKVQVNPGCHMVVQDVEYEAGDTLTLTKEAAKVQINAGIVTEVKETKSKETK